MDDKSSKFVESDVMWERKELTTSLENIFNSKGKFVFLRVRTKANLLY